jgi:Flavin containing amine oxidoreductase
MITPSIPAPRTLFLLTSTARELIERVFPELRDHFRGAHLTRWSYASHRGDVGYYTALQRFRDSYPADEPVQVAGDYLASSGQESAVVAGVNAARRILNSVPSASPTQTGRAVLTPVLTRRCLHGGRKPAKPMVANVLTDPALSGMT